MLRRQCPAFHTEQELEQATTVKSSDSRWTADGKLGNCRVCLQVPVFLSHSLTVCTPEEDDSMRFVSSLAWLGSHLKCDLACLWNVHTNALVQIMY